MQAAGLDEPQAIGGERKTGYHRIVKIPLKDGFDMELKQLPLREISGLLQKLGLQLDRRLIDGTEDPLDRLDKARGRIFHAWRQIDPAPPRLVIALVEPAAEHEGDEPAEEHERDKHAGQDRRGDT